jgi:hypothetical protein
MKFYALDWAAMLFSLSALHFLGNKRRIGFLCFLAANACWLGVGWLAPSLPIIAGNCVFAIINLRGYGKWNAKP